MGIYIVLSYVGTDLKGRIVYNCMHCGIPASLLVYPFHKIEEILKLYLTSAVI